MLDLTGILAIRNPDPIPPDTWLIGVRGGKHKPLEEQVLLIIDQAGRHIGLRVRESWSGGTRQPDGTIVKVNEDGGRSWQCVVEGFEIRGAAGHTVGSYTDEFGNWVPGPAYHQSEFPITHVET